MTIARSVAKEKVCLASAVNARRKLLKSQAATPADDLIAMRDSAKANAEAWQAEYKRITLLLRENAE